MLLPSPPDDREKLLYLEANKYFYYIPAICSGTLLFVGFFLFSIQHYALMLFLPLVLVLFVYLFISYFIGLSPSSFSYPDHLKLTALENRTYYPTVDIYLPSCGEDLEILRNTYHFVRNLYRSSPFQPKVWVLDDSNRLEVKKLTEEYGFYCITRPTNELKKAGNLRYAFAITQGELIVILDADFVPREDFLDHTVPYFLDENIAIVQTPQFFNVDCSQSLIERGAGYVQELFYRLVQRNRDSFAAAVCVGTAAIYRRTALNSFGGTAAIGYSEDLHTGFNITKVGRKVRYLPLNLAKGICPSDLKTFFYQQYRWAMGSTTLALNPDFWTARMSFRQKLCYASGFFYYVATALGLILTPLPAMIMLTFFPEKIFWFNYVFSIPSLVFTTLVYATWCKSPFTWFFPVTRFIQYWSHLFAIVDKLRGSLSPWQTKLTTGDYRFRLFQNMNIVWFGLVLSVTVAGLVQNVTTYNWYNFIPLTLVTLYNLSLSFATWRVGLEKIKREN